MSPTSPSLRSKNISKSCPFSGYALELYFGVWIKKITQKTMDSSHFVLYGLPKKPFLAEDS